MSTFQTLFFNKLKVPAEKIEIRLFIKISFLKIKFYIFLLIIPILWIIQMFSIVDWLVHHFGTVHFNLQRYFFEFLTNHEKLSNLYNLLSGDLNHLTKSWPALIRLKYQI